MTEREKRCACTVTVGAKGQIPQEAAKKVLILAGTIIAAGGVLNYFVKKRRER